MTDKNGSSLDQTQLHSKGLGQTTRGGLANAGMQIIDSGLSRTLGKVTNASRDSKNLGMDDRYNKYDSINRSQ